MTKRVLGHGAKCCGECDTCAPKPPAKKAAAKKSDWNAETVIVDPWFKKEDGE